MRESKETYRSRQIKRMQLSKKEEVVESCALFTYLSVTNPPSLGVYLPANVQTTKTAFLNVFVLT